MAITTLLVDDVPSIRTLLRVALRRRGDFELIGEAGTGDDAVRLAGALRPDLIVLDLGLPDLAPRDLLARVRRTSPTSRIVIFSASELDRSWFEQRTAGYVVKDTDIEHFLDLLADIGATQAHDEAALELPHDAVSARDARVVVRDLLDRWGFDDLVDDASIVVSELVANAVVHGTSTCAVVVNRTEAGVRIEVRDENVGAPQVLPPDDAAEGGRGLMIVSALATDWGVQATTESKTVWVELSPPG